MVDFLIPEKKLILETQGPQHYIKRIGGGQEKEEKIEPNLMTEFKNRCLRKLGFQTLILEGLDSAGKQKGFELDLFEKYEQLS